MVSVPAVVQNLVEADPEVDGEEEAVEAIEVVEVAEVIHAHQAVAAPVVKKEEEDPQKEERK